MKYSEAKSLISSYIHENTKIQDYWDLSFSQKEEVVKAKLKELTKRDRESFLTDIDPDSVLSMLAIAVIEDGFSEKAQKKFFDAFKQIAITGTLTYRPYYYYEIQQMINDEISEQRHASNENFYDDVRERTLAAQWGQGI